MKKLNILKDLYQGRISRDKAYDIQDQVIDDFESGKIKGEIVDEERTLNIGSYLGLTRIEWAAHLHGVSYDIVAKWRYEGWPNSCSECGKEIIPENFGWWAGVDEEDNGFLTHIKCLKPYKPEPAEIH
jgi:hypothetical protein